MFLLALLAGCTAGDDPGTAEQSSGFVPLQIGRATVERVSGTRAAALVDVPDGSLIGVFRRKATDYTEVSNEPYRLRGTQWEAINPDRQIGLKNATANLGALYPFGALPAKGVHVTLTARLWSADKEAFYATFTASVLSPAASFTLKHVYSRVSVVFKRDKKSYADSDGKITTFALEGTGIYTTGTLDVTKALTETPFSGYATPGYSLTGIVRNATLQGEADDSGGDDCVDLLMVPNTLSGKITLKATIDGKLMSLKLNASQLGGSLEAGKRYHIAVTIKGTAISIGTVYEAGAWEDVTAGNNGNMQPLPEKIYDAGAADTEYFVKIGNTYWATRNLKQQRKSSSEVSYSFESLSVDHTTYWNWGMADAEATSYYNGEMWNNNNGDTYKDPCSLVLGNTSWRLPTKAELEELLTMAAPPTTKVRIYMAGIFTVGAAGVISPFNGDGPFAIFIDGEQERALLLPAGGYRQYGSPAQPDEGFYWCSQSTGFQDGHALTFKTGSMNMTTANCNRGHFIRCVKK